MNGEVNDIFSCARLAEVDAANWKSGNLLLSVCLSLCALERSPPSLSLLSSPLSLALSLPPSHPRFYLSPVSPSHSLPFSPIVFLQQFLSFSGAGRSRRHSATNRIEFRVSSLAPFSLCVRPPRHRSFVKSLFVFPPSGRQATE